MLCAPADKCQPISELLAEFGLSGSWFAQPIEVLSYQLKTNTRVAKHLLPNLVSSLAVFRVPFEVETECSAAERYLYHPGLGIHRQMISEAGDVLLRGEAVEAALVASRGSAKEFERRLRLMQGIPWLDLLEAYRSQGDVRLLHKAI